MIVVGNLATDDFDAFEEQLNQRDRKRFRVCAHNDEPAVRAQTLNAVDHGFGRVGGAEDDVGAEQAKVVSLEDESGNQLDPDRWSRLVDLSLASGGQSYTGAHDLIDIARFGHFTRPEFAWDQIRLR